MQKMSLTAADHISAGVNQHVFGATHPINPKIVIEFITIIIYTIFVSFSNPLLLKGGFDSSIDGKP